MTSATVSCIDGEYTIAVPGEGMTAFELVDDIFKPIMLAMGYSPFTVAEALNQETPRDYSEEAI